MTTKERINDLLAYANTTEDNSGDTHTYLQEAIFNMLKDYCEWQKRECLNNVQIVKTDIPFPPFETDIVDDISILNCKNVCDE